MGRGNRKGEIRIDVNDIVGTRVGRASKYGKPPIEIFEYDHCEYDNTDGGPRMRHYYNCICHICFQGKTIRRETLLAGKMKSCGCLNNRRNKREWHQK